MTVYDTEWRPLRHLRAGDKPKVSRNLWCSCPHTRIKPDIYTENGVLLRLPGFLRVQTCGRVMVFYGYLTSDGRISDLTDSQQMTTIPTDLEQGRKAPAFNIGLVLQRDLLQLAAGLSYPRWRLVELKVLCDSGNDGRQKTELLKSGDSQQFLWTGLRLEFFRDGGESYWHTLVGEQQQVYAVLQEDDEHEMIPLLVTADYDEAMAYQESDDTVVATAMPAAIYQVLERFVLENYTPEQKRRRKRKQWHGQEQADEQFARKPRS